MEDNKKEEIVFDYQVDKSRIEEHLLSQIFFQPPGSNGEKDASFSAILDLPGNEAVLYNIWHTSVEEVSANLCAWSQGVTWSSGGYRATLTLPAVKMPLGCVCRDLLDAVIARHVGVPLLKEEEALLHRLRVAMLGC